MDAAMRSAAWLAAFATMLAAWAALYASARTSGVDWLGRPAGASLMPMETLGALCADVGRHDGRDDAAR